MPKHIYGITGSKQHGKDTFSSFVRQFNPNFTIIHFADPLRELCSEVFNIPVKDMEDPELKEKPFLTPLAIDCRINKIKDLTGLDIKPKGLYASHIRQLLQMVGTDYIRAEKESFWRDKILEKIEPIDDVLISDTRYLNEANLIKSLGGKIIRINRIDMEPTSDTHSSEVESRSIQADLELGVKTGNLWVSRTVADCIADHDWDSAKAYNYTDMSPIISYLNSGYDFKTRRTMIQALDSYYIWE